jgi:PAS domain S-box-containing protein
MTELQNQSGKLPGIQISEIDLQWNLERGVCTFEKMPVIMAWVDSTLAGLMSGLHNMVGTERFILALQSQGRKSTEADLKVIHSHADFRDGFKAIANIAAVAGWGRWELLNLDRQKKECHFRVTDSWEGLYQKSLGVCWGSGMLAGKMAGYCSYLFETNCWAEQTSFIARGDSSDDFVVTPSIRSIENEIENLLSSDRATQADMAVAMRRLEKEISERKKSEEMIRSLVETSQDWIWAINLEGRHTYSNPAVTAILGYRPEDIVGEFCFELMHDEDRANLQKFLPSQIQRKQGWRNLNLRWRHKNGSWRYLESNAVPILDLDNRVIGFRGMDRDITEHKQLEEQLNHAQKMEAIGQLAGGVAHDFNNLLHAILGYTDLILEDLDEGSRHRAEIAQVRTAAERASTLTRQLLAFSRRQVIQPAVVNLNEVIAGLMKMLGRLIGEHIQLDIVQGNDLQLVRADPGQIEQVLMNLCINARDAMPDGGQLRIETQNVEISPEFQQKHAWPKEGRFVLIRVADTGRGMDRETLGRIFEPFFTTKDVGEGTGLGLSTVYGIVQQHGGFIRVNSEAGKGSTFDVYLPTTDHIPHADADEAEHMQPGGNETILIAEDEELVRELAARVLAKAGYAILQARNGQEALQILEEHGDRIDLAFLDVVMPGLSGRDVQNRIKSKLPRLRFLFTSGYSSAGIHTNFVLDEGTHFIQKPYYLESLLKKVREALEA